MALPVGGVRGKVASARGGRLLFISAVAATPASDHPQRGPAFPTETGRSVIVSEVCAIVKYMRVYEYPKDLARLDALFSASGESNPDVLERTAEILERVRRGGDKALCALTARFDHVRMRVEDLRVPPERLAEAWRSLPAPLQRALRLARRRILTFHRRQLHRSWTLRDAAGLTLTQRWAPLRRVGVYVPGGSAAYPSTVLMNVIPAQVAGVPEIAAVTPPARAGVFNTATLGALHLCGIREVYAVGGAQAVAALAYGTSTIARVHKVVGPGNAYVAAAKRLLYGTIDIDSIAGPSEVLILADETAPAGWIAADLLAQAEHSPDAQSLLALIGKAGSAERVSVIQKEIARRVEASPRAEILRESLRARGAIIRVADRAAAVALANRKAAEHLEIVTRNPGALARRVHHAGSIFLGAHTPEALGDYVAGPNHVLPTGGTARFASALGVDDFLKVTQVLEASPKGLRALGQAAITIAEAEGLYAHAETIRERME